MGKKPKTYVVERLLAARDTAYGREYRVHWADYSSAHDSWEPEENILDTELIDEFHQGVGGKAAAGKAAAGKAVCPATVSYTHLTLPTILRV